MNIIYKDLKRNNIVVIVVSILCFLICSLSLYFSYKVYLNSKNELYAINDKGIMIPINKVVEKEDFIIVVKSAISYFVEQYYSLDQYNLNQKREKVLWLADEEFQNNYKDKANKGYFNRFIQTGAIQKAKVIEKSIKISSWDSPFNVEYDVMIEINNGGNVNKYIVHNNATLLQVSRNYPYNPFGILYTKFVEGSIKQVIEKDITIDNIEKVVDENGKIDKDNEQEEKK